MEGYMKIKKIKNQINLEEQFDVELQGCSNDCKEYFAKTKETYQRLRNAGYKVDGTATIEEIEFIREQEKCYCYRLLTPKTSIYL